MIRKGNKEDVETVAWTVLTALDMDTGHLDWIKDSCADERSMYSWNKAFVALVDGKPVGSIVSYSGDDYKALREYTWKNLWHDVDLDTIRATEIETYPGEYYLDSLAIKPEYRGHDIGKQLIEAAMSHGRELGYTQFALLVDVGKPRLKAYYESLGFKEDGTVMFFGHRYNRLKKEE